MDWNVTLPVKQISWLGLSSAVYETMVKITNLFLIDFCFIEQMVLQSFRPSGESNFSYKSLETSFYTTLNCKIHQFTLYYFQQIQISNYISLWWICIHSISIKTYHAYILFTQKKNLIWLLSKVLIWLAAWWR